MQAEKATLPPIPKFPEIPSKEPRGSVKMADSDSFQEVRLDIPIRPDGSVEEDAVKMLEEVGKWMDINGQADFPFDAQDLRFTLGKDGCLYVFTMAVPEDGRKLTVHTLKEGLEKIKDVSLLGFEAPLEWSRSPEGLVITCPRNLDNFNTSLVFRISLEK